MSMVTIGVLEFCHALRASAFGQGFFALWVKKKEFFKQFVLNLGHVWCSVITSIIFSSNPSNFKIIIIKKICIKKNTKHPKIRIKSKKSIKSFKKIIKKSKTISNNNKKKK